MKFRPSGALVRWTLAICSHRLCPRNGNRATVIDPRLARRADHVMNGGKIMGRTVSSLSGALLAITVMAAFAPPGAAQQGEPVKIGVLIGLTGSSAVAGNDSYKCMQIAAEEVNAAGGVLGRPIKLVVQDDEGRPKAGVDGANLLGDVEKVGVAIGGYPRERSCRRERFSTRKKLCG